VVHDLRNHLTIIVGFCELLLNQLPGGDLRRDDVREIRKAGDAAMALLPALSKLAR